MRGRDGCRVPLPWSGDRPPVRLLARAASAVAAAARRLGRSHRAARRPPTPARCSRCTGPRSGSGGRTPGFHETAFAWNDGPAEVLDFDRGAGLRCVVNLGAAAVPVPADSRVLLASAPLDGRDLPPDAAVWLRRG